MATTVKKQNGAAIEQTKKSNTSESTAAARRAKKREQDRQCQQRARQRTRDRIVYLEEMVQNLKQQNTTKAMEDVWRQRDEIAAQRDALAETLRVIERALQTTKKDIPMSLPSTENENEDPRRRQRSDSSTEHEILSNGHLRKSEDPVLNAMQDVQQDGDQMALVSTADAAMLPAGSLIQSNLSWPPNAPIAITTSSQQDPIIPHPIHSCECSPAPSTVSHNHQPPINYWRFANEILQHPTPASASEKQQEDELEHDAPVRAMLEGWDAVEQRAGGKLPPSWQQLRQIDEVIFQTLPKTERLAIMRVMHSLFRYHQEKSPEKRAVVPSWHLARPSQEIAHSYAIDYFAWPGIRERFVFHQHRYCSNRFWTQFCTDLRVLWPFEFRDCYSRNVFTGEYKISPAFLDRIQDIRAWTMSEGMFDLYPEFRSDIPVFDPSIASIVFKPPMRQLEAAAANGSRSSTSPSDSSLASQEEEQHQQEMLTIKSAAAAAAAAAAANAVDPMAGSTGVNASMMPDTLAVAQDHYLLSGDILQSFNDFGDLLFMSTAANAEALPIP